MMYQEYKAEVLERLQAEELTVLKKFDSFCRARGIEYFACGGTLLGAVRHQGFIPWDDDLDVGMTREHYEKFLRACREETGTDYDVMNFNRDQRFPVMITKWYKKGTIFRDEDAVTCGYSSGIGVDIFCFDNVADEEKKLRRQAMQAWIFGKLLILRQISDPTIYAEGKKAQIMRVVSKSANRILTLMRVSPELLYRQAAAGARKYEKKRTRRVAFLFDPTPYTSMLKRSDIYPTRELKFEDMMVKVPNRPQVYLRTRYGKGYMELPPENKRHNHPPAELSFGADKV